MDHAYSNALVVTADDAFLGSVLVRDGVIAAIDRGASNVGEDFDGDVLMPGVIDLHTDNLEKHFFPRPNIDWNPVSAAVTHDGCCLSVGVTTVFDSMSIGSFNAAASRNHDNLIRLVDGVLAARDAGMLKGDHRLHWRCETPADDLPHRLEHLAGHPLTSLFSLMDHTPGQRQYRNLEKHLANWRANGMTDEAVEKRMAEIRERQARNAANHRQLVADVAKDRGAPLASHDDEDVAHIDEAADLGATVAEFPVTVEAARRARERGMIVVMGGPNLIRGGSYSGNVPASELAEADLLDAFASDYVPRSLVECAFALTDERFGWSLPRAVALVTSGPARAGRLDDRGVIEVGRRADLVRVSRHAGLPVVRGVWVEGQRARLSTAMRIVTLNTWKNEAEYERRLGLMREGLAALSPDVVCLQEAFVAPGLDTAQTLADSLKLWAHAAPARFKPRDHEGRPVDSTSGLAVLTRWPAISTVLPLQSAPADGERIAQRVDISVGDRRLRVLNLHLTHLRSAGELRAAQLSHALAWASEDLDGGLVVAGDLNATAADEALAPLGLPMRAGTLHGARLGAAIPAAAAIDHCVLFHPGGWQEVAQFRGLETPDVDGWFPSDHAGVGIDLAGDR